jgi:hypothetical protein
MSGRAEVGELKAGVENHRPGGNVDRGASQHGSIDHVTRVPPPTTHTQTACHPQKTKVIRNTRICPYYNLDLVSSGSDRTIMYYHIPALTFSSFLPALRYRVLLCCTRSLASSSCSPNCPFYTVHGQNIVLCKPKRSHVRRTGPLSAIFLVLFCLVFALVTDRILVLVNARFALLLILCTLFASPYGH